MQYTLVVVDDHPLVRQGLLNILAGDSSFQVIGEAATEEESLTLLERLKPDIALIDVRLGEGSGLTLIEKARKSLINSKFIIITSSNSEEMFLTAERLGVSGYILKEALPEEILLGIRIVAQGRRYYDPGLLSVKVKDGFGLHEELTQREKEVLTCLGKGKSNREIAAHLFLSENTVKKHVSHVLAKLNLADRTQAALYAHSKRS